MKKMSSPLRKKPITIPLKSGTETKLNPKTVQGDPQEWDPPAKSHQPLTMLHSELTVATRGATVNIGDTPIIENPELLLSQRQNLKKG